MQTQSPVLSQAQEHLELRDIYDFTYNPWWLQTWFFVLVALCVVGVALFFVYRVYTKRKVPALTPQEQTLRALEKLDTQQAMRNPQEFYTQVTGIVKQYIEQRYNFGFRSVGLTDDEFLRVIEKQHTLSPELIELVKEIFNGVVFIKFAQGKAALESMQQALSNGKKIVMISSEEV